MWDREVLSLIFQAPSRVHNDDGNERTECVHSVRVRVSRAIVYRLVAEGRIPAVRISSGAIRVPSTS
jgi:hypothetical protein